MPNVVILVYAYSKHVFLKKNRHTGPIIGCAAHTHISAAWRHRGEIKIIKITNMSKPYKRNPICRSSPFSPDLPHVAQIQLYFLFFPIFRFSYKKMLQCALKLQMYVFITGSVHIKRREKGGIIKWKRGRNNKNCSRRKVERSNKTVTTHKSLS